MAPNAGIAVKDLDGDGLYEILTIIGTGWGNAGKVFCFDNIGIGTNPAFAASPVEAPLGLPNGGLHEIYLCDIDGDGDYDLFVSGCDSSTEQPYYIRFFRNNGTPQAFSFVKEDDHYWPEIPEASFVCPYFLDADGDNDYDALLFYGIDGGYYGFMENTGTSSRPSWSLSYRNFHLFTYKQIRGSYAFGDLNDDGNLEIIQHAYDRIALYKNQGSPSVANWTLADESFIPNSPPVTGVAYFTLKDMDGDGDLDLLLTQATAALGLRYYRNNGAKSNPAFTYVTSDFQGTSRLGNIWNIAFADLTGDGLEDLVFCRHQWNAIYYVPNTGTQQSPNYQSALPVVLVTASPPPGIGRCAAGICFTDVDRDGDLDLFVAIAGDGGAGVQKGRVNFFRNQGPAISANFVLENPDWLPAEYMQYPGMMAEDINGDGLDEIFITDSCRGLRQFAQINAPALDVYPTNATLVSGHSHDFKTSGSQGSVSMSIVNNRSGAIANGLTYTAGSTAGVADKIRFTDSGSTLTAYAYVNVISPSQVAASGKAVVMAGRKPDDPLWDTTNYLANSVYRMLLYRGFSKGSICYLNPVSGQDVDGNGANDDVYAASSLANIQDALTTYTAGSPNLFIYLIDHGDADAATGANGLIRCNESDVLYASSLKSWLDDLQANHGVTTVTLVVDCCQSGSFLKACAGAPAGCARVVACSSSAIQPSFFSAGGLISFTDGFVNGLYSGMAVGQAFRLAAGGMDRYQQPIMDDNGDGVYDKDSDGAVADRMAVGATNIAGADRPQIGDISANQTLTSGATSATIWALDVSSMYPINNIWATIAAPDFIPGTQSNPNSPVTELTTVSLTWNASATPSRYEATLTGLTQMGAYRINMHAQDIWGGVSYPKQTYINQTELSERIAIVCGNGAYDISSPWSNTDYLARSAYETARVRWLGNDDIIYLTAAANSEDCPVDGAATKANLQSAIAAAATASPPLTKLTVYLVGASVGMGADTAFDVDGDGATSDPDDVTVSDLDGWLDSLQTAVPGIRVLVVLDFSHSGAWIAPLQAPVGKERVVVTSCGGTETSWCEAEGMLSFSQWFFGRVFSGANVHDAFTAARNALRAVTGSTQNAQLDDNGSGTADRNDGALALHTYIGAAFVTGADTPIIGDYAKNIILTSNTATLWASGVWSAQPLAEVFAIVIPPGANAGSDLITIVQLRYHDGTWKAAYEKFDLNGSNEVIYFAKDRAGTLSQPYETTFHRPASAFDWTLY